MKFSLRPVLLGLNLISLAFYGASVLVFLPPFQQYFEKSFFGYGHLITALGALAAAGIACSATGVLSIAHWLRERRWSWELSLGVVNCVLVPGALLVWSISAG